MRAIDCTSVLNCEAMVPFWIRWDDTSIALGKGFSLGEEQILRLVESDDVVINALSLGSRHEQPANWEFLKNMGKKVFVT